MTQGEDVKTAKPTGARYRPVQSAATSPDQANQSPRIVVIGGGFTGLAAAYEALKQGAQVTVLEADRVAGGLAACFEVKGEQLERFYHFWYNTDQHLLRLVDELELNEEVVVRPSATGMYYAGSLFRLATPLDVLRFKPLSLINRLRLGLLVLAARRIKSWRDLDHVSAAEWLSKLCGKEVFRVVWEPLLLGKFGKHAYDVSAAWFWAKLLLRGGSRGKGGAENLMYFKGGFKALVDYLVAEIRRRGGNVRYGMPATGLEVRDGVVTGVRCADGLLPCDGVIATTALPIIADVIEGHVDRDYGARLRKIGYLGNVCLVLELKHSLSELYWMNVNDPSFPFVGIIEHTNFEPLWPGKNRHIVYLSKYLSTDDPVYAMSDLDLLHFALPHIQRMFPSFNRDWIIDHHVWRADYAQPLAVTGYAELIPDNDTPIEGFKIASMAQIYPEDRGTNHAIREGRLVAGLLVEELRSKLGAGVNGAAAGNRLVSRPNKG
ncbi:MULTISPECIES: NAD(P)/FAD-dependent oxidoreductase [unclassified Sinorhizobium]|uniref:NAD(P)/FAD-dependent oxidoreductase n=1 Tax=unclassified Sinorhizobium TaxID=2613772 RepID=UPI0024C2BECE|nr:MULTISPECIES: NAD(P)/FAD-dependent oxidoreductase [unclassified Sinorhizobium]MDK1374233.1 NAD(P)/FAD-dependent oxidoreductase [Sinorhizobium sp. 6-70]MDK1481625.1 NAD(P)/FAD-dependent oxidoreductase [Sinorhizobium sp. 6-117]